MYSCIEHCWGIFYTVLCWAERWRQPALFQAVYSSPAGAKGLSVVCPFILESASEWPFMWEFLLFYLIFTCIVLFSVNCEIFNCQMLQKSLLFYSLILFATNLHFWCKCTPYEHLHSFENFVSLLKTCHTKTWSHNGCTRWSPTSSILVLPLLWK